MNKIDATIKMKCPRCHEGDLFETKNPFLWKKLTKMHDKCSNCNLKYERETGFFYGAMYISSFINMLLFVAFIIVYYIYFDERLDWRFYMLGYVLLTILITPLLYRLSRSIWIEIFIDYKP